MITPVEVDTINVPKKKIIDMEEARLSRKEKRLERKRKKENIKNRRKERKLIKTHINKKLEANGKDIKTSYLIIGIVIIVTFSMLYSGYIVFKEQREQNRILAVQKELKEKKAERLKLKSQVKSLNYVEVVARKELKLIKQDEILYILPKKGKNEKKD